MPQIIIQRSLFSFILLLAFIIGVKCWSAYTRRKIRSRSYQRNVPLKIEPGHPVLLYFWTSSCSQCKPQERQIEQAQTVLRQLGTTLQVQRYNALEEQVLVQTMHVLTVPTTGPVELPGKCRHLESRFDPRRNDRQTISLHSLTVREFMPFCARRPKTLEAPPPLFRARPY